ncbi:MAG: P-loop NTPase fold protein [Desulfobacter sp.]
MESGLPTRGCLIFKRWLWITAYVAISLLICQLLSKNMWIQKQFFRWAEFYISLPWVLNVFVNLGFLACICFLCLKPFGMGRVGIRAHLNLRYLSFAWAVWAAVLFWSVFGLLSETPNYPTLVYVCALYIVYLLFLIALTSFLISLIRKPFVKFSEGLCGQFVRQSTLRQIEEWIKTETYSNLDFIDYRPYVNRLAERLKYPQNPSSQIVLKGNFGIGKTNICKWVEKRLAEKQPGKHTFVEVDGWGRQTDTIAEQILAKVIEKLSRTVDCTALNGLPSHYIKALEGSSIKGIKILTSFFSHSMSPERNLQELDRILRIINTQLVIVLEDFDRNPDNARGMNQLSALLDRLRKLKQVSFIINIAPYSMSKNGIGSNILERVCTYREDIEPLSVSGILETFYFSERNKAKDERLHLLWPNGRLDEREEQVEFFERIIARKLEKVSNILSNPRQLKICLRRTQEVWKKLKGEVLLEELLLINALRVAAPSLLDGIKSSPKKFNLDKHLENTTYDEITTENFRTLSKEYSNLNSASMGNKNALSIFHKDRYDLNRKLIFREELSGNEFRAQKTIQILNQLENNSISEEAYKKLGLDLNQKPSFPIHLMNFMYSVIPGSNIPKVMDLLIHAALDSMIENPKPYPKRLIWYGVLVDNGDYENKKDLASFYGEKNVFSLFWSHIEKSLSVNLWLPIRFFNVMKNNGNFSRVDRKKNRARFADLFYENVPDASIFLKRLDPEDNFLPEAILKTLFQEFSTATSPAHEELADIVLEAFEKNPEAILWRIAGLFIDAGGAERDALIDTYFGSNKKKLLALSTTQVPLSGFESDVQKKIELWQRYSGEVLNGS